VDIVLVHGTTQSPDGWQPLVTALTARGHHCYPVDLLAGGTELTAAGYAALAAEQLDGVSSPIVVGHSGAGLVLPAMARALDAVRLVWLGAAIPDFDGGRSFVEQVRDDGAAMFTPGWRTLTEPPTVDPVVGAYFLFHDCPLATLRWAVGTLRLFHPVTAYEEKPLPDKPSVPSTVVVPTADRALLPSWMRDAARERLGVEPVEVAAGHCPHVAAADAVAELIDQS
jgi:pimeloyl-ACP methyl ester carboxylesterase